MELNVEKNRQESSTNAKIPASSAMTNLHAAFADFPMGAAAHQYFHHSLLLGDGPLPRVEREWLAMETSIANESPYGYRQHCEAFAAHGGQQKVITRRMELLSTLAATLSRAYWKASGLRDEMLAEGFTPAQWQHAVMLVSYFNFTCRCAQAMDLALETD